MNCIIVAIFVTFSERSLQRIFKKYGLKRYDDAVTPHQVANAIQVYPYILDISRYINYICVVVSVPIPTFCYNLTC